MTSHPNPEHSQKSQEKNKLFTPLIAKESDVVWRQDPKAYITIMPYPDVQKLMVRVYDTTHKPLVLIEGETPQQVYYTLIKEGLVTTMEHAAYVGKELAKAYIAMKMRLRYVQDDDLQFEEFIE